MADWLCPHIDTCDYAEGCATKLAAEVARLSQGKTFWLARDKDGFMGRHYSMSEKKLSEQVAHGGKVFFGGVEIEEDEFKKLTGLRLRRGEQVQARIIIVRKR